MQIGDMVATRRRIPSDKVTKGEIDRFITICINNGCTVRHHTHPKTRAKWIKRR